MEHRPNTRPDPLVDADTLVGILFAGHRPSVRWLRYQTKTRTIVKRHTLCDRDGTHVIRLGMLLPSAGRKLSLAKLYTKALLRWVTKVNSEVAYDYIRKRILSGEYPPNCALLTVILSDKIGISRTPLREALLKLEADGLVTIRAGLVARVKKMDVKEFQEMCELRLALEGHASGLAAMNRSQTDLGEIKLALGAMRRLTESIIAADDEDQWIDELIREDVLFHIAVMTASRNDLMKSKILQLRVVNRVVIGPVNQDECRRVPEPTKSERDKNRRRVLASHEEIYEAIERNDAPAAKKAMERHIKDIIAKSLRIMTNANDGPSARKLADEELMGSLNN